MKIILVTNLCIGVTRPMSITYCENVHPIIKNIIEETKKYDLCIIVNDGHMEKDVEFKYLPQHHLGQSSDSGDLVNYRSQIKIPIHQLHKYQLSVLSSETNKGIIKSYKPTKISVVGFTASMDVVPTTLNLIDWYSDVSIIEKCVGDSTEQLKQRALSYIEFLGVPIIKG